MSDQKSIATGIIRAEHRTLAAVINSMKSLVGEMRVGRMTPDFQLFWSMVHYIDAFPDQLHHPKEDDWLFARIQQRTHDADGLIDELGRQHRMEESELGRLRKALGDYEAGVAGALDGLDAAMQRYAEFNWKHMAMEERELLPIAEDCLTAADWDEIVRAFQANGDPLAGRQEGENFTALFRQIVEQTPAPLGLAARRRP